MKSRMVYMAPGEGPMVIEEEADLATLQKLVGGYISIVGRIRDRYVVWGDEEARLKWRFTETDVSKQAVKPNRWIDGQDILGPVVVQREDEESMSGTEALMICALLKTLPRVEPHEVRKPEFSVVCWEESP